VIVGAYKGDGSSNSVSDTGEVHVVFGKASGFAASIQVSRGGGTCVRTTQERERDTAGGGRGSAGDGARVVRDAAGAVRWAGCFVCGQASSLDGTNGFTIYGREEGDHAGYSLSSGDVNGDGYADVLVGSMYADGSSNSLTSAGEVHVVFGKASGFAASIQVIEGKAGARVCVGNRVRGWALQPG